MGPQTSVPLARPLKSQPPGAIVITLTEGEARALTVVAELIGMPRAELGRVLLLVGAAATRQLKPLIDEDPTLAGEVLASHPYPRRADLARWARCLARVGL